MEMTLGLNLESCPDQISKFGELSKSAVKIWLPSDSWQTTYRLLTDSWLTPDWLLTDSWLTFDWSEDDLILCWKWHQVSIWRAVQISSPNLKSFLNQLSKFGYYQTPKRVLEDSQQTFEFRSLTPDGGTSSTETGSKKDFGWWHQFSICPDQLSFGY